MGLELIISARPPPVNLSATRLKSSRRRENARPAAALITKTCREANYFLITYVMILVSPGEFYFNSMNLWTIIVMSDNNLTRKEQNAKEWVWLRVVQINAEYKWCSCKFSKKLLKIHELKHSFFGSFWLRVHANWVLPLCMGLFSNQLDIMNKGGKILKKLWCCVGGRV